MITPIDQLPVVLINHINKPRSYKITIFVYIKSSKIPCVLKVSILKTITIFAGEVL